MGQIERAACMDVSNTVDVSSTDAVAQAVTDILAPLCPALDLAPVQVLFTDFDALYRGHFPGFQACDVPYHDARHVLDVTLAMARLLDGLALSGELPTPLAADALLVALAAALFHDAGYIRREGESAQHSGATFTRIHVTRSERLLQEYLPDIGLARLADACGRIVHFTGYEIEPPAIPVADETERLLGHLLGTADLIAQMADINYIAKCRDDLYQEFVDGGVALAPGASRRPDVLYQSPRQLLEMTPEFIDNAVNKRLDGHFRGVHRYSALHFGGRDLYMDAIAENQRRLAGLLAGSGS